MNKIVGPVDPVLKARLDNLKRMLHEIVSRYGADQCRDEVEYLLRLIQRLTDRT